MTSEGKAKVRALVAEIEQLAPVVAQLEQRRKAWERHQEARKKEREARRKEREARRKREVGDAQPRSFLERYSLLDDYDYRAAFFDWDFYMPSMIETFSRERLHFLEWELSRLIEKVQILTKVLAQARSLFRLERYRLLILGHTLAKLLFEIKPLRTLSLFEGRGLSSLVNSLPSR